MRRTFLIILAVVGGLVALLFIAVAIAVWRIDPNDLAAPIQARIKEVTGRDATIHGSIDLKLSLTPRLVLRDLALANASWGQAPSMVAAKQLDVEFALLPLLTRRFEVIRVELVEPAIALETDAQGRANWDFGNKAVGAPAASRSAAQPAAFGVGNVAITRGVLTYRDGKSGAETKVAIDSLSLSARDAQSPVKAEFRGKFDDVAVAMAGQLGPLESLVQRRWPYAFALEGEIDGQKARIGARLRVEGETIHVEEIEAAAGPNVVAGTISVATVDGRSRYTVDLTAPVLSLTHAAGTVGSRAKGATVGSAASSYLFSEAPLPLSVLRAVDATGQAKIGRLVVSPAREFTAVDIRFTLRDGRLDVSQFRATTFGGSVDAHATLDVPAKGAPQLALTIDARNLDLGMELAAFDVRRDVKGGKSSLKANITARGSSLHEWAASASGNATAIAGPATIVNAKAAPDSAFDRVASATNPFRDKDPTTELKCIVVRLPLAGGVARIDRSVAIETQKVGVSVSGTLDLRSESIDLTFKPQLRQGITIDIPQIAELVRLHGPFRHPQVSIDAMASVTTAARIGAAFSTGGLSEIGVALLGAVGRGGAGPCAVALGAATNSPTADAKAPAAAQGTDPLNKALGKLFGR